jgi:hypothetical protein
LNAKRVFNKELIFQERSNASTYLWPGYLENGINKKAVVTALGAITTA